MNRVRLKACIALAAIAALLALARSGALEHGPVICPLRAATGVPCGSCGLTRAAAALTRGELVTATRFHATSVPLGVLALIGLTLLITNMLTGQPALRVFWRRRGQATVWIALGLVAVGWSVNLARRFGAAATAGIAPTPFTADGKKAEAFSHSQVCENVAPVSQR